MRRKLKDYAAEYCLRVDGSKGYAQQLGWCVSAVEKELGREVFVDELTADLINELVLAWKPKLSTVTVRSRRNMLYRLAKVASRDERLKRRPRKPVRDDLLAIKRKYSAPTAWSPVEVATLVETARWRMGHYRVGKVPIEGVDLPEGHPWVTRSAYWTSYILAAWDTGLRSVDLTRIKRSDVNEHGRFSIVQSKTGKTIAGQFRPATMAEIVRSFELTPDRTLIWPVWLGKGPWFRVRKRLLARAGLSGGMQRLRHSAGTAAEIAAPGTGHLLLGNSVDVFFRFYFDQRHVENLPQPPALPHAEPPAPRKRTPKPQRKPWERP